MRYGIISDIHGNFEALEAVINSILSSCDRIICLGDIVGYGPLPNECIERIRQIKDVIVVAGNHDMAAVGKIPLTWFNPQAKEALLWTQSILKEEYKDYLLTLPQRVDLKEDKIILVHGSLYDYLKEYIISVEEAEVSISLLGGDNVLLVGHTHYACYFKKTKENIIISMRLSEGDTIDLVSEEKIIINVGAVGQPRDGDVRASYGILDTKERRVNIMKKAYNISKTQELMRKAQLPRILIDRLAFGM